MAQPTFEQDEAALRLLLAAQRPVIPPAEVPGAATGHGQQAAARCVYTAAELEQLRATPNSPGPNVTRALRAAAVFKGPLPTQHAKRARNSSAKDRKAFARDVMGALRTSDVMLSGPGDFHSMLLEPTVLRGLHAAGYLFPTPIQWKAIPIARAGVDLIAQAKSGTGKTCVFCVLAVEAAIRNPNSVCALILAPTREIASQIAEEGNQLAAFTQPRVSFAAFIGGTSVADDAARLSNDDNCSVVVGTPGRIAQLIREDLLKIEDTRILVLDEADNLLGGNMQETVHFIAACIPETKQVCTFSATYPSDLIRSLTDLMRSPQVVNLCSPGDDHFDPDNIEGVVLDGVKQMKVIIPATSEDILEKVPYAIAALRQTEFSQAIVFSGEKSNAKKIASRIRHAGFSAAHVHGDEPQAARIAAIEGLRNQVIQVLVASDLISRGVDFAECSLVINLDVPRDAATYLHRVGRSGRFGGVGHAVTILFEGGGSQENKSLEELERKMGFALERVELDVEEGAGREPSQGPGQEPEGEFEGGRERPHSAEGKQGWIGCGRGEARIPTAGSVGGGVSQQARPSLYSALEQRSYWAGKQRGRSAGAAAAELVIARLFPAGDARQ